MDKEFRELKEAEHIFNVTLKNNRSLETIKSFLKAIVNFYDKVITEYLNKLVNEGKLEEVPKAPLKRLELFKKNFTEQIVEKYLDEYKIIRRCLISKSAVINEHRRNIEAIFIIGDKEIKFSLKDLKEILERAKEFNNLMKKYL